MSSVYDLMPHLNSGVALICGACALRAPGGPARRSRCGSAPFECRESQASCFPLVASLAHKPLTAGRHSWGGICTARLMYCQAEGGSSGPALLQLCALHPGSCALWMPYTTQSDTCTVLVCNCCDLVGRKGWCWGLIFVGWATRPVLQACLATGSCGIAWHQSPVGALTPKAIYIVQRPVIPIPWDLQAQRSSSSACKGAFGGGVRASS
jgi:hypothetical protein